MKKKNTRMISMIVIIIAVVLIALFFAINGSGNKDVKNHISMGDKYLEDLDYEQALAEYKAALEIDPDSRNAIAKIENVSLQYADSLLAETEEVTIEKVEGLLIVLEECYQLTKLETIQSKSMEVKMILDEKRGEKVKEEQLIEEAKAKEEGEESLEEEAGSQEEKEGSPEKEAGNLEEEGNLEKEVGSQEETGSQEEEEGNQEEKVGRQGKEKKKKQGEEVANLFLGYIDYIIDSTWNNGIDDNKRGIQLIYWNTVEKITVKEAAESNYWEIEAIIYISVKEFYTYKIDKNTLQGQLVKYCWEDVDGSFYEEEYVNEPLIDFTKFGSIKNKSEVSSVDLQIIV